MFSNFTEESGTGTGNVIVLTGAAGNSIPYSASFADGDQVHYAMIDSGGRMATGLGTFDLANNSITRTDNWSYNGSIVNTNPSTNITFTGGTLRVICTNSMKSLNDLVTLIASLGAANGVATLNAAGLVPASQLPPATVVFGSDNQHIASEPVTSTTSTSFQPLIQLTIPVVSGRKYRIGWGTQWRSSAWNKSPVLKVTMGTTIMHQAVPQAYNSAYGYVKNPVSGFHYFTATSTGNLVLKFEYRCYTSSSTVYLNGSQLEIWRVS